MVDFITAVYGRFNGDTTLCDLVDDIHHDRNPDEPEKLDGFLVVFRVVEGGDELGLHGAASNSQVEVKIWGYGPENIDGAWAVADRVTALMIAPLSTANSGTTVRLRASVGWQKISDEDPDTIHLQATYGTRYWNPTRIAAITG